MPSQLRNSFTVLLGVRVYRCIATLQVYFLVWRTYRCQWPSAWRLADVHASDSKSGAAFLGSCRSQTQPSPLSEMGKERWQKSRELDTFVSLNYFTCLHFQNPSMTFSLSLQIHLFSSHCHHLFVVSGCSCMICLTKKRVVTYVLTPHHNPPLLFPLHFFVSDQTNWAELSPAAHWPHYTTVGKNYTGQDTVIFNGSSLMCSVSAGN